MPDRRLLVVGGGFAGMALSVFMRRQGWAVDIVEADPEWRVYGAGITITGATFRAFDQLGLVSEIARLGFCSDYEGVICTPLGIPIHDIPGQAIAPGLPVTGGIMRPIMHGLLAELTRASGAQVRLGVTVERFVAEGRLDADAPVTVVTSDGRTETYDLIVGADGAFSPTRAMLFPDAPAPTYTGQYCWRVEAERPPNFDKVNFFMAGQITAGLVPVSPTKMYMWLLQPTPHKVRIDDDQLHTRLIEIMAPFGGPLTKVREGLDRTSPIVVRPLEALLLPKPWHRGRVLLIGDAAHSTTPHLASGAGIATEDALVLSEVLKADENLATALPAFTERRFERCRLVVENSVEIGRMQQGEGSPEKLNALMARSMAALRAAI